MRSLGLTIVFFLLYTGLFVAFLVAHPTNRSTLIIWYAVGLALIGALMIRQIFTLAENHKLYQDALDQSARMKAMNRELEENRMEVQAKNEALADANLRLQTLAASDPVVGLPNQRAMLETIGAEFERSNRTARPFSLLFLDLDHFKSLNDRHGHLAGDEALRQFAQVVKQNLRTIDTLSRWGGEEFVVLLPESDADAAFLAAERVRSQVAKHTFHLNGGVYITCSIGVATYPVDGRDPTALVETADQAMYASKRLGRNQIRTASDPAIGGLRETQPTVEPQNGDSAGDLAADQALALLLHERQRNSPYNHAMTVLATRLALTMGLSESEARRIGMAAQLQNIGNVAIPDAVLQKKGKLTEEEREIVRRHPAVGAEIVAGVPALAALAPIIMSHHEWWNGQGYPAGLEGDAIPLGARIIAVVDVYKALTTERPHRPARTPRTAFDELRFRSGTQFDPKAVDGLERTLAPNPVMAERIMVDEYEKALREELQAPLRELPPETTSVFGLLDH